MEAETAVILIGTVSVTGTWLGTPAHTHFQHMSRLVVRHTGRGH